jgi:hypothetical protein
MDADEIVLPECGGTVNAPAPHTRMVCFGVWRDHPGALSIFTTSAGNFFPGQKQKPARFDSAFPLPAAEQDWQTNCGGQSFFTTGLGISGRPTDEQVDEAAAPWRERATRPTR